MKNFKVLLALTTVGGLLAACSTSKFPKRGISSEEVIFKTVEQEVKLHRRHALAPVSDRFTTVFEAAYGIPSRIEVMNPEDVDCKLVGGTIAEADPLKEVDGYSFVIYAGQKFRCGVKVDKDADVVTLKIKHHIIFQPEIITSEDEVTLDQELLRLKGVFSSGGKISIDDIKSLVSLKLLDLEDPTSWRLDPNIGHRQIGNLSQNTIIILNDASGEVRFPKILNLIKGKVDKTDPSGKLVELSAKERAALPFPGERAYSSICTFAKEEADDEVVFRGASMSPVILQGPGSVRCVFNSPKGQGLEGGFDIHGHVIKRDRVIKDIEVAQRDLKEVQKNREIAYNDSNVKEVEQLIAKLMPQIEKKFTEDKVVFDFWASREQEIEDMKKDAEGKVELARKEAEQRVYLAKVGKYFEDSFSVSSTPVAFQYYLTVLPYAKEAGIKIHSQRDIYIGTDSRGGVVASASSVRLGAEESDLDGQGQGSLIRTNRPWSPYYEKQGSRLMLVCRPVAEKMAEVSSILKSSVHAGTDKVFAPRAKVALSSKQVAAIGISHLEEPNGYAVKSLSSCEKHKGPMVQVRREEKYHFCFQASKSADSIHLKPVMIRAQYVSESGLAIQRSIDTKSGHDFFKLTGPTFLKDMAQGLVPEKHYCVESQTLFPEKLEEFVAQIPVK